MKLLMIGGERGIPLGKKSPFWYTLELLHENFKRIDVICPETSAEDPLLQPFDNVFFHPSPQSLFWQTFWITKKGKELIKTQQHDLITSHVYPPFYNDIGACKLSKKSGVPLVLEYHDGKPVKYTARLFLEFLMLRFYLPILSRQAKAIRTVNEQAKKRLAGWGIAADKIYTIPSFYIDLDVFSPDFSQPKKYDFVFCGRHTFTKGLGGILKALSLVPEASLAVIGDGPLRKSHEKLAEKLQINSRVSFLGWLPEKKDIASVFRSARAFILNSTIEGGPRVTLEAMACGLPVISTPVGIMNDVIADRQNGFFCSGSTFDLADKMRQILNDENNRQKMAKSAVGSVKNFEGQTAINNYADFLKSLV